LGVGGFCTGLLPLLLGVCIYETKKIRDEDDSDDDDGDEDDDENTEN
jgi:hypothetical protein